MRIRTVTVGVCLEKTGGLQPLHDACKLGRLARVRLAEAGYEVQTTRIVTNCFEEYTDMSSVETVVQRLAEMDRCIASLNHDSGNAPPVLLAVGPARSAVGRRAASHIIPKTTFLSMTAAIEDPLDFTSAYEIAEEVIQISKTTDRGYGNFRFCMASNLDLAAGTPYFPIGFHPSKAQMSFGVGLECSDFVTTAFAKAQTSAAEETHPATRKEKILRAAEAELKKEYNEKGSPIVEICEAFGKEHDVTFLGIDSSVCPSLSPQDSLVTSYESILPGANKFGGAGTLMISSLLTRVVKDLDIKTHGYCGLMLPVCEDTGLAQRAAEGTFRIGDVLSYSSVCGLGLDTVPVQGDVGADVLASLYLDVATLSVKLNKPLTARIFPVPGKQSGEEVRFDSPYMCDSAAMALN